MKAIPFNTLMAKADIGVRKTQTRRILKLKNKELLFKSIQGFDKLCALFDNSHRMDEEGFKYEFECVYLPYKYGEALWVREPAKVESFDGVQIHYWYQASRFDERSLPLPDRFKENVPNWISKCQGVPNGCIKEMVRTVVMVTNLKVERLMEISEEDAIKEGVIPIMMGGKGHRCARSERFYKVYEDIGGAFSNYKEAFSELWEAVSGRGSWERDKGEYVVAYDFVKIPKEKLSL